MRDTCVTVRLLGPLTLLHDGRAVLLPFAGATRDLLGHLLMLPGKELRRDALADLFWEDAPPERARAALSTAVWRINKLLRALPALSLAATGDRVRLEMAEGVTIDALRLEQAVLASDDHGPGDELAPAQRGALTAAVAIAAGPFLEGSGSDWVMVERERYFNLQMRALTLLMQDSALRAHYEAALAYGHRILAADPFREQVQCEVMWLHVLNGQRVQALRQYHQYEALLAQELGIRPMSETRALHQHIRYRLDEELPPVSALAARVQPPRPVEATGAIERARRTFYLTLRTRSA